jgi:hypothetical protein
MPITAYTPHSPKHIDGPLCPKCGAPMSIIRIEPLGGRGYDLRTFECRECQLQETVVENGA